MDWSVVYHCDGSVYISAIAAAIHLGQLPVDRKPHRGELLGVPLFAPVELPEGGRLIKVGVDSKGISVYILGRGREVRIIQRLLNKAPNILLPSSKHIIVAEPVSIGPRLVLLVSKTLGNYGKGILLWWVRSRYRRLVASVDRALLRWETEDVTRV